VLESGQADNAQSDSTVYTGQGNCLRTRRKQGQRQISSGQLQKLILEEFHQRHPDLPVSVQPVSPIPIPVEFHPQKVSISDEQAKKQLIYRLKRFLYPYPHENKSHRTFYRHVKNVGALDLLLKPPLFHMIKFEWYDRGDYGYAKRLYDQKKSQPGFPLDFHGEIMWELGNHLERIAEICRSYRGSQRWLKEYGVMVRKQLLREASIYYPKNPADYVTATKTLPRQQKGLRESILYEEILNTFSENKILNNKLAQQLTALICSPPSCIQARQLNPSPETIRRNRKRSNPKP
jgi:hypothetical protein